MPTATQIGVALRMLSPSPAKSRPDSPLQKQGIGDKAEYIFLLNKNRAADQKVAC
jgi:hypothetical protein